MTDKTTLVVPGRRITVMRPVKRLLQIGSALALTSLIALFAVFISAVYAPRGGMAVGFAQWLAIIKRPDIQATAILTAVVSVLFVYWQRDRERK